MAQDWILPDGFTDSQNAWTDEASAYDGNTGTFAYCAQNSNMWQQACHFTFSTPVANPNTLRLWVDHAADAKLGKVDIHLYDITETMQSLYQSTMLHGQYVQIAGITLDTVSYIWIRFEGGTVQYGNLQLHEIAVYGDSPEEEPPAGSGGVSAGLVRRTAWRM